MGKFLKIHPLPLSTMTIDKGFFTYLRYYGEKIDAPSYAWLIQGGGEPILVDVGCSAEEHRHYSFLATGFAEISSIEESLKGFGLATSDIKTIIITHMDADHILNARKFPNARFIVQEEELRFARNPHPLFVKKYYQHLYEGLNFEIVKGDIEVIPGVEVILTPGHTAGNQSVVVTTERGKAVIVGFCSIDENFSEQGDIIPGNHFEPFQAYESNLRVREIADIIIPLHGRRLLNTKSIP